MGKITPGHVAAAAAIGAAAFLAWTASRAVPAAGTPNPLTELEGPVQNFQEHLAHAGELLTRPVFVPHRYPAQTCPGITATMHQGFTPLYELPDPQIAALPAQEPW